MPTIENDDIVFRFPEVEPEAKLAIKFMRTLRIPDSDRDYPLPPGLGQFPLQHVEDFSENLSDETAARGGVILPIWQAEAMWLNFVNTGPSRVIDFPVAIKVAAGKINAVSGAPWEKALHRSPQDYVVSPHQKWLDGFAIERGIIRQFVAMPLGDGYSAEEQITGEAEWGGIQILAVPLKKSAWNKMQTDRFGFAEAGYSSITMSVAYRGPSPEMGMAPGGKMRQIVERDRFALEDWDLEAAQRVFVSLIHAKDWKAITGLPAPNFPPTASDYAKQGLPWFEVYGADQCPIHGGAGLSALSSVGDLHKEKTGVPLTNSADIVTPAPTPIRKKSWRRGILDLKGNW